MTQAIAEKPDTLSQLIERLEKCSGPDRELDHAIELFDGGWHAKTRLISFPEYTRSLDAALTLVPEGWECILYTENNTAELYERKPTREGIKARASGATPAISLCIAALKARTAPSNA